MEAKIEGDVGKFTINAKFVIDALLIAFDLENDPEIIEAMKALEIKLRN